MREETQRRCFSKRESVGAVPAKTSGGGNRRKRRVQLFDEEKTPINPPSTNFIERRKRHGLGGEVGRRKGGGAARRELNLGRLALKASMAMSRERKGPSKGLRISKRKGRTG